MQIYKPIVLLTLIVFEGRGKGGKELPKVPEWEDPSCKTPKGAHYCYQERAVNGGQIYYITLPGRRIGEPLFPGSQACKSNGFTYTLSCCNAKRFEASPDVENVQKKNKDIFVTTRRSFKSACPKDAL
ncbi:hypothetical protein PGTUg99_034705 [Puccinia graminis f. sp. tritici]|uniref:Uncharacterized protein n=1 Tax=Puccinia graminis f. sp. tritici TaxID=56615 RepID=A0A5B0R9A7_PUCGR|nr:hypothetical protein PGTUg99_034705 [Puccinia graminis f. sp. tritici]